MINALIKKNRELQKINTQLMEERERDLYLLKNK